MTARRVRASVRAVMVVAILATACSSMSPQEVARPTPNGITGDSSSTSEQPPASSASPTSSPKPDEGPSTIRLRSPARGTFLVRGSYPRVASNCVRPEQPKLLARYPGALRVQHADDGTLALTVTLPFDEYLQGIAEVPPTWPTAALEAQAIAARSYALATTGWDGADGETLPTPICATTACQVYRGIPVPFDPTIRRWFAAVRRTSGQVLLFDGRPADTVYFSTSNGRTYGNDEVFGSAPLPYLRPVVERDDGASPTSRWSVRIPFDDLARFLHEDGLWPRRRAISIVRLEGGRVSIEGDGATRSMDLATFRDAVNVWAPCLAPGRYPPGALPITVPSRWVTLSSGSDAVVATGRGWGHGAGMVQWGAYGKALRGLSASAILAYYYGGLEPQSYPEPGLIHVQVASGLTSLRIKPSRPGASLDGRELGLEHVTIAGGEELSVSIGTTS